MNTYIIEGKKYAAASLAQAMFAARKVATAQKPRPMTDAEEQRARRTQPHGA